MNSVIESKCEQNQELEIPIHTYDRISYRRCRRKWAWSSPIRGNLDSIGTEVSRNMWFGTGFHFAMEDYHGYHRFQYPEEALEAFYNAYDEAEIPTGGPELIELGMGMLSYYKDWIKRRDMYKTLWLPNNYLQELGYEQLIRDDQPSTASVPMVEVHFALELKALSDHASEILGRRVKVVYHGTLDRICTDGREWYIQDYKTAANIDTGKLAMDTQVSAYAWGAEQYLHHPISGVLYSQFAKHLPDRPTMTTRGGFSIDKRQKIPYDHFRKALIDQYGEIPSRYNDFLDELASRESIEGDSFIRTDLVIRNKYHKVNTYWNIVAEGKEMINPDTALYPNPTRDCSWDCPFNGVCSMLEDGYDYEYILETEFAQRARSAEKEVPEWRKRIRWPKEAVQQMN